MPTTISGGLPARYFVVASVQLSSGHKDVQLTSGHKDVQLTSGHKLEQSYVPKSRVRHVGRLLRLVRTSGRFNQRTYHVCKYLDSLDAKLLATIEADEAMRRNLGLAGCRKAKREVIASKLDPGKGTDEPVLVYRKKKSSGQGHRFICKFGIEHRALQYLVRDVLIALVELHPNQYATHGGVHAAIKHTKQALMDGDLWAAELDINNCYQSFDESKLPNLLPLPKEVTDHVIISRYLNLSLGFSWHRR